MSTTWAQIHEERPSYPILPQRHSGADDDQKDHARVGAVEGQAVRQHRPARRNTKNRRDVDEGAEQPEERARSAGSE
jgi:hypothetical protein